MSLELFAPLVKPTAAQMNALDAAIAALEGITDGVPRAWLAAEWNGAGSAWMFRRKFRWLVYNGTGTLNDPAGVAADVSLADPDDPDVSGVLDLDTLDWLPLGKFYAVTGCTFAVEVATPPNS